MHYKNNFLILLVVLFLSCSLITATTTSYVAAQEKKTLLDVLFGQKQPEPKITPRQENRPLRKKPANKAQQKPKPAVTQAPRPQQSEKSANAKKILFLGDFVASAMSAGLDDIYADNANYKIIKRTDGSSGLVRDDYYDWHKNIDRIIKDENPDIIIFAIGANDRQAFKINKKTIEFGSEEWDKLYQERVSEIIKDLEKTEKPWLWAGLPSFGKAQLHQSAGRFNAFYNAAVSNTNGQFIDLWSGFVDDKGNFALSGYDMNGQTARLRNNDGISFTPAGQQKLAFYVKAPIEAVFETKTQPTDITIENIINDATKTDEEQKDSASDILTPSKVEVNLPSKKVLHIPPTNLTDLNNKASELGGKNPRSDMELPKQSNYDEQKGRADYFKLP